MLIPEIALTYQTVQRVYGTLRRPGFRDELDAQRRGKTGSSARRAERGELDVIIGPRSALFVPFPNLG